MTAKNDNPNITIGDATPIMNVLSDDMSCDESANDARAKSGWLAKLFSFSQLQSQISSMKITDFIN